MDRERLTGTQLIGFSARTGPEIQGSDFPHQQTSPRLIPFP